VPVWTLVGDLLGFIGSICLAWPANKLSAFPFCEFEAGGC
jgi:hypothetical protein